MLALRTPGCIFKGVAKLPPGHVLTWDAQRGVDITQYWSPIRAEQPIADER